MTWVRANRGALSLLLVAFGAGLAVALTLYALAPLRRYHVRQPERVVITNPTSTTPPTVESAVCIRGGHPVHMDRISAQLNCKGTTP